MRPSVRVQQCARADLSRWRRVAGCVACAFGLAGGVVSACGARGAATIGSILDERDGSGALARVDGHGAEFGAELIGLFRESPCEVRPRLARGTPDLSEDVARDVARLSTMARAVCETDARGVRAIRDARGMLAFDSHDGRPVITDRAWFLFGEPSDAVRDGTAFPSGPGTVQACGVTVPAEPALTFYLGNVRPVTVVVEAETAPTVILTDASGGTSRCGARDIRATGASEITLGGSTGPMALYVVSATGDATAYRIRLEASESGAVRTISWAPGETIEVPIYVGAGTRQATDAGAWCSGWIGDSPSLLASVSSETWGTISLYASVPSVIVAVSPNGTVNCAEIYDRYSSFGDYVYPGIWTIYVGPISITGPYDATLSFY